MADIPMTVTASNRAPRTPAGARRFGTFEGVFTPTLLTILGVIMYLREGWVVGQIGAFWCLGSDSFGVAHHQLHGSVALLGCNERTARSGWSVCDHRSVVGARAERQRGDLVDQARIPRDVHTQVLTKSFGDAVSHATGADVNVFGLPETEELEFVASMVEKTASACLFVRDSGDEDALA